MTEADIHQALARNLGHVSRQRVRYIQMELRKYSTDSRMRNERQFWAILENSGLRFPVRTAKHFLSLIKDQRGINVEIAMKYLNESQKKTRRDSVEALIAGELALEKRMNRDKIKGRDKPKQEPDANIPSYATMPAFKKMTSRLSLDEFRRVGRMVANVSAITGVGKQHREESDHHNNQHRQTPIDEEIPHSVDGQDDHLLNMLLKNQQDSSDNGDASSENEEVVTANEKDNQNKPQMNYLTVPQPEKKSISSNSETTDKVNEVNETIRIGEIRGKKRKKMKRKNQPMVITIKVEDIDANASENEFHSANESAQEEDIIPILQDNASILQEHDSEHSRDQQETPTDSKIQFESTIHDEESKDQEIDVRSEKNDREDKLFEETEKHEGNNSSVKEININELTTDEQLVSDIDGDEKESQVVEDESNISVQEEADPDIKFYLNEDEPSDTDQEKLSEVEENEACTKLLEDDITCSSTSPEGATGEPNENMELESQNSKSEDSPEKTDAIEEISEQECETENIAEDQDSDSMAENDCKIEHESTPITDKESVQKSAEIDGKTPLTETISCGADNAETGEERNDAVPPENPHVDDFSDYSSDSFIPSDVSETGDSDFLATSSVDDEETNEVKETECDTKSILDFGGETIYVGKCEMTVFPPEWNNNKEYTDKMENYTTAAEPKLELNWVYSCEISHPQSMTSVGDDEIVYGSGCIVVLYNHARYSQRHYLGHSGPISCLTVHPDQSIIGSAQSESLTATKMMTTGSETLLDSAKMQSHHGRIHIRVWSVMDLTTLYVMGVGSIQHNIRKMQFMNYKSYILTIEDDEEASLTLWDGGCKIKRISTSVNENKIVESVEVSTRKGKIKTIPARKSDNGPRGLAVTSLHGADFVIAGKEHLGFWTINDIDYSDTSSDEDFVKIIGPQRGDFVKHFLPRFVTCCVNAERSGTGLFVTGDTNGTLLVWSENSKEVIAGCKHAHECPIACVLVTRDHIFTGGSTDKKVRAFNRGKRQLERVGNISLPTNIGQIASISIVGENLFVGTSHNLICTIQIDHPSYALFRTISIDQSKPSISKNEGKKNNNTSDDKEISTNNILGQIQSREIARGSKEDIKCVCAAGYFTKRPRTRAMTPTSDDSNLKRLSKSAIFRRPQPFADTRPLQSARSYKPKINVPQGENSRSQTPDGPPKLTIAFSSPKLRTSERILRRSNNGNDTEPAIPFFAQDEYVDKRAFAVSTFPKGIESRASPEPAEVTDKTSTRFFVVAANDGWITIYDTEDHCCVARTRLKTTRDFTCMDCCSKRSMLVVGSSTGHVILFRLAIDGFEQVSETYFRCKRAGRRSIACVRFSTNGKRIAISVGNEVVIASVKSSGFQELERCLGHNSETINSLDWSSERLRGSDLLRTTALVPDPELFVWSTEPVKIIDDLSTVRNIKWQTNTGSIDFAVRGVWDHFTNHEELSCMSVTDVKYVKQTSPSGEETSIVGKFKSTFRNWRTTSVDVDLPASNITCCVGDVLGCIRSYHFPSIASYPNETLIRVFHSPVSSLTCLTGCLVTCGNKDHNVVQFEIAKPDDENKDE